MINKIKFLDIGNCFKNREGSGIRELVGALINILICMTAFFIVFFIAIS